MSRFLPTARRAATNLLLRPFTTIPTPAATPSAFTANLLRLLSNETTHLVTYRPPAPFPPLFNSFSISPLPGHNSIRLTSHHAFESINIEATMVDAAEGDHTNPLLHISLLVEVSKTDTAAVLTFICSAWPDSLEVDRVFSVRPQAKSVSPYMGPDFKELDDAMQDAVYAYLEERGVDDDLAEFMHDYVANKDKAEMIQWLGNVEKFVQK